MDPSSIVLTAVWSLGLIALGYRYTLYYTYIHTHAYICIACGTCILICKICSNMMRMVIYLYRIYAVQVLCQ